MEGARAALLAAQVARILRAFEIQGLLQTLLVQRRAVFVLAQAWPSLPAQERAGAESALRTLLVAPTDVESLRALDRRQLEEYRRRQRLGPVAETSIYERMSAQQETRAVERSVGINNAHVLALLKTVSKAASRLAISR